jgi:transposase
MNRLQNGLAWPGYSRPQKMLGIDRSTVIRNVRRLEKNGHLSVKRRRTGTKNAPNEYQPNIKPPG